MSMLQASHALLEASKKGDLSSIHSALLKGASINFKNLVMLFLKYTLLLEYLGIY